MRVPTAAGMVAGRAAAASKEQATDRETVVFLVPADGWKPAVVLDRLFATEAYLDRYETRAVVDGTSGRAVDRLDECEVTYVVTGDASAPLSAITRVTGGEPFAYLVSCGWERLIPPDTIDAPTRAAVNCHSSYLPDYRGPSSPRVQWANGEREGGATIHLLTEEYDAGRIICRERVHVSLFDTPREILLHSAEVTAVLLRESLLLLDGGYEGIENGEGRYFSLLPWRTVLTHGVVNRLLWLVGSDRRWLVEPTR